MLDRFVIAVSVMFVAMLVVGFLIFTVVMLGKLGVAILISGVVAGIIAFFTAD